MEKFRDFAIKYLKIAEKDFERARRNLDFFKLDWSRTRYPFIFKGKVTIPEEYYGEEKAQQALRIAEVVLNSAKAYLVRLNAMKQLKGSE